MSRTEAIVVRLAELHDREALCRLYHQFHEFHVSRVPDRLQSLGKPPETYEGSELYLALEKIIVGDNSALFLAQVADQPIGMAEVYLRQDDPNPCRVSYRHGYLQSLMVDEAFRQHGVGRRLIEATHTWAKARGATEMRLETWEFAQGPLEFYRRMGYRTLRRTLVRGLESQPPLSECAAPERDTRSISP